MSSIIGTHNILGNPTRDKDGNMKNAKYFVNTVTINRIVIRDKGVDGKPGNIMIVKYPG